jgi:hypothetical protein
MEKRRTWKDLDEEITALAKRVNATAGGDTLEVLFSCLAPVILGSLTGPGGVMNFLPRVASDARVSLRVENLARS